MAIINSYDETNVSGSGDKLYGGFQEASGQSFSTTTVTLTNAAFYLKKTGSPTGSAYAKLYAHTGVYGTSSNGTGSALATSDAFDVSNLTTSIQLITFNFTGANQYALSSANYYVISIWYEGGSSSNYVNYGVDGSSPSHDGNNTDYYSSAWHAANSKDLIFYVYGTAATSTSPSKSPSLSPSASPSQSPSPSLSPSASPSVSPSPSLSPSKSPSLSPSVSPSTSPSPGAGQNTGFSFPGAVVNDATLGTKAWTAFGGTQTLFENLVSTTNLDVADVYNTHPIAQTFTPSTTHTLNQVRINVNRVGSIGTVTVGIYATSSNLPTGSALAVGTLAGGSIATTGAAWYAIDIVVSGQTYGLEVVSGTQYAIVVSTDGATLPDELQWSRDDDALYAGGNAAFSSNSGASWTVSSSDQLFEEKGLTLLEAVNSNDGTKEVYAQGAWISGNVTDTSVKLFIAGVVSGTSQHYGTAFGNGVRTYGGPSTLWGLTPSVAEINASNFGFGISLTGNGGVSKYLYASNFGFGIPTGSIINGIEVAVDTQGASGDEPTFDYVQIKVYYTLVGSVSPSVSPSLSPSKSPSLSPSVSPSVSPSPSLSPSVSPSVSPSPSLSPSVSPSKSPSVSPSRSGTASASPSLSSSLSPSLSPTKSPSLSPSVSPSLSPSLSPSAGTRGYSRGSSASLPTTATDLTTDFTTQDYTDVETADGVRVVQTAISEYSIFQFNNNIGTANTFNIRWIGQTNLAPNVSAVYLDLYNRILNAWVNITRNETANADTDFTISLTVTGASVYRDVDGTVTARVYQLGL